MELFANPNLQSSFSVGERHVGFVALGIAACGSTAAITAVLPLVKLAHTRLCSDAGPAGQLCRSSGPYRRGFPPLVEECEPTVLA